MFKFLERLKDKSKPITYKNDEEYYLSDYLISCNLIKDHSGYCFLTPEGEEFLKKGCHKDIMDIEANLKEQLEIADRLNNDVHFNDDGKRLAELVEAMNE